MPSPKEVFDNPHLFWEFLKSGSDSEFEGQHFDRKVAGVLDDGGKLTSCTLKVVRRFTHQLYEVCQD